MIKGGVKERAAAGWITPQSSTDIGEGQDEEGDIERCQAAELLA